jgi:hypothetical protein
MALTSPSRNLAIRAHFGAEKHALALPVLYFALFNGQPDSAGVEPSGVGGYARVARNNDADLWGNFTVADSSAVNKGAGGAIVWPAASGLWSVASVNHWAIFDNSAGGVLWYWGKLAAPLALTGAGDVVQLPPSTLTITQAA